MMDQSDDNDKVPVVMPLGTSNLMHGKLNARPGGDSHSSRNAPLRFKSSRTHRRLSSPGRVTHGMHTRIQDKPIPRLITASLGWCKGLMRL
jgi:hypothetical protein